MEEYTDESIMPFGKHKGKKLIDVPDEYLLWLYNEMIQKPEGQRYPNGLFKYLEENLDAIEINVNNKR